jgi:rhodanese-related sulfurtransferase
MARRSRACIFMALIAAILLGAPACRDEAPASYPPYIGPAKLAQRIRDRAAPLILDVRSPGEYLAGHVPGAANVPYTELSALVNALGIEKSDEVVVYCQVGPRAVRAEQVLVQAGYTNVRHLQGHMQAWQQAGYPTE